ncbi:MAG TPA: hypothetical protein VGG16_30260 [Streptosporangiaceae bacterium]
MPADTCARSATRVLAIYNLGGRLRSAPALMHSLAGWFDMGRFAHHITAAGGLLPRITDPVEIDPARFRFADHRPRVRVHRIAAAIATTPRRDGLLFLDFTLGENERAEDVADFLYTTWHRRPAMRVDDSPLLDWLATPLSHVGTDAGQPLSFGQNVHQCVFAGGRFARRLLRDNRNPDRVSPDLISVVFRGTIAANRGSRLDIRRPAALNNPGETLVAHGRGVSLITGWTEPVENAFGVAAAGLVNAAGVVSRVRLQSLEALTIDDESSATKASDVRDLITDLTERLNQLRLDLSFGIEAYADMILIPELLIESYHSSLRSVASLRESLANTSRIVDRVAAVIESRHATLEASVQAYTERRDKALAALVAIGSLLALPPALLLAYFGTNSTNVDAHRSIFDLRHYGVAYLVVWLPFIALAVAALVLRWRIQPRTRGWGGQGPHGRRRP